MPKITLLHFSFKHFTAGKLRVVILYVCLRIENTSWNYYTFSNQFIQGFTTVPVRTLICSLQILSHFFLWILSGFDDPTNGIFQKCTSSYFRHPNWKFALGAGLRALNALTYLSLQGREGEASLILMYYRSHTPQTSNLLQCSGCCHCQPSKKIGSKTEASQIATTAPNHSIGDKKRSWRLGDIVNSQPKPMCLCFDSGFKAFLMSHVYLIFVWKFRCF